MVEPVLNFLRENNFPNESLKKVGEYFRLLSNSGSWTKEAFLEIVVKVCKLSSIATTSVDSLRLVLGAAFDYCLTANEIKRFLYECSNSEDINAMLRRIVCGSLQKTETKSVEMISSEMSQLNASIQNEGLQAKFREIFRILENQNSVGGFSETEFRTWSKNVRKRIIDPTFSERIAIVWRAMELASGHKVRNVQILSLMMLYQENGLGKIAQINTGEGKTIIIAMLAVLLSLKGHKVDVGEFAEKFKMLRINYLIFIFQ